MNRIIAAAQMDIDKARLKAYSAPHSGDWLQTPPISSIGLKLIDEDIRIAVTLRLGTRTCGQHGLSCGKSALR